MKDDVSRWTNTTDEACKECLAPPGDEHAKGCVTGNRDVPSDDEDTRKALGALEEAQKAKTAAAKHIKTHLEILASMGYPKEATKRALADSQLTEDVRRRHDTAYMLARKGMGIALNFELFE